MTDGKGVGLKGWLTGPGDKKAKTQPSPSFDRHRVAVLPLSNISPDPKDGYFADGMTEELITVLSNVQGLRVIAKTSAARYKSGEQRVTQIGTELGVGSLIEGSVRFAGDKLRVTVQLIDASNEEHMWSENYDRKLDDIFAIQSDIARRVAEKLEVKLLAKEKKRLDRGGPANMDAYKNYLKGRTLLARRNPGEMIQAREFFEKAIREDPTYAPAFAGLADAYGHLGGYWAMPIDQARKKSDEFLSQALKLDPDLAEARATLALNLTDEYRFTEAESEFRHAIDLNPSYAMAHMWYANCLGSLRRYDEQLEQLQIAERLDPLSTIVLSNEIWLLVLLGRKEAAWEKVQRFAELDPNSMLMLQTLVFYHYLAGDHQRALSELEKRPELHNEFPVIFLMAMALAATGQKTAALGWLDKLLAAPDTTSSKESLISAVYLELGQYDQAFEWANKGVDKKQFGFSDDELYPAVKRILTDPRRKALLKRVNLDKP